MNLREFGSWALAQGSVANPEPNYKYKGQCVSLIQQYLYNVLGLAFKAYGNAKDWATNNALLEHFYRLNANTKLQRGDILVYGKNYGGGYGHIGFIDANGKYFDQNGVKSLAVGYRDTPFKGYICVLRSKKAIELGDEQMPKLGNYKVNTSIGMKVRTGPGTNYAQVPFNKLTPSAQKQGGYKYGVEFTALEVRKSEDGQTKYWARTPSGWVCLDWSIKI